MLHRRHPIAPRPSAQRRKALAVGTASLVLLVGATSCTSKDEAKADASPGTKVTTTTTTTTPLAKDADQYQLAYLSTDAQQTTVFLTDGKGSKTSVLAKLAGQAEALQWAPDGTRLLLDGDASGDFEIQVVATEGGAVTALASSPSSGEGGASWSPDGTEVVFFSDRNGAFAGYVVAVATGDVRRVTPPDLPPVTDLSFSPDGRQIAFSTSTDVDSATWVVGADGTGAHQVTDLAGASQPRWSPDGTQLAVSAQPVGTPSADLYLIDVATGKASALAATAYLDSFPTWAADGESVYFASAVPNDDADGGNADDLYRVAVTGGKPTVVTSDPVGIESEVAPSADGRLIAFSVRRLGDKEVFVANADGTGAIPISRSERLDAFATWRPGTGPDA